MILLAYARNPRMALLVIDPQGQFSKDIRCGSSGEFALPVKRLIEQFVKKPVILEVKNLVLDRWELFEQILFESLFLKD